MEFKNNKSNCNKCSNGLCCTKIENLCVKKGNQEILKKCKSTYTLWGTNSINRS